MQQSDGAKFTRALIVAQDNFALKFKKYLKHKGTEVFFANSASQIFSQKAKFDVLFVEVMQDNVEIIEQLFLVNTEIPVIFFTSDKNLQVPQNLNNHLSFGIISSDIDELSFNSYLDLTSKIVMS